MVAAPVAAPVSERRAANLVVGNEIYEMFLADRQLNYFVSASVNEGVVTLRGTMPDGAERQRLNDQLGKLAGVNLVNDERGGVVSTTPLAQKDAGQQ